jgi:3-hydroxybutyryl-CoA dehydrogenase
MKIETVWVIGAGQMGAGIAQVCAQRGILALLSDETERLAQDARTRIARSLEARVTKGRLSPEERDQTLARIAVDGSAHERADLVVEAVTERFDAKGACLRRADETVPAQSIIASNTSSLSITRLAAQTRRPDRVVGLHFMNPVPAMALVEVVRGLQTSDDTLASVLALVERLGKKAVESRDRPGFIVNRMLIPLLNEACFALDEGLASAVHIDESARLGLNHPMGPLELADLIGLDTVLAIAEVLERELGDKYRPSPLLRSHVDAGYLGRKSGRGFYYYDAKGNRTTSA